MVPADDDHKSTNEGEKNTLTQKNFVEKLKFWDRDKKDADEPARLKTLPKYLMHWLTPVWIAAAGFLIALAFAVNWRGEFHWPSADAMKLCATIAGAGFAFSAWQQRSHDNVVNAKQAQATAEREDYWKRREHIYQLLGSKNPGLRLSAVALLAELADSAAHSTLLKETEKQQLQRHIIDTLCLQVRHEGLCIEEEGDEREHTTIQQSILMSIFQRINHPPQDSPVANWSESTIGLNDCTILTPVSIRSIRTNSTLDLRGTTFEKEVKISESTIKDILWNTAHFNARLNVTNGSDIGMLLPPAFGKLIRFQDTTIRTRNPLNRFTIPLLPCKQRTRIDFTRCKFYDTTCKCPKSCECKIGDNSNTCQCSTKNTCTCIDICINTNLQITTPHTKRDEGEQYPEIAIINCTTGHLRLLPSELAARMIIKSNLIHEALQLSIGHVKSTDAVHTYINNKEKLIILEGNIIQIPNTPRFPPITFQSKIYSNIDHIISFNGISLRQIEKCTHTFEVTFRRDATPLDLFHFTTLPSNDHQDTLKYSWDTGSLSHTYHKALACSIKERDNIFKVQSAKIQHLDFVTQAYDTTRKFMSEYAMETDWTDDHFSVAYAAEDIEQANCYIVYNGDTPCAAFVLNPGSDANNPDKVINWRSNMNYYMIQRISAVLGDSIAHSIFNYAATRANYLRCLTHERNYFLRHALDVFGFKECGTFTAEDGTTRVAYDWIKETEPRN